MTARSYKLEVPGLPRKAIQYSAELNDDQLAAVTSGPGAALVIAGAGSGKTRTLTYRVAWLLEQGVPARNILLLTFTNKAAREMLDRVAGLLPGAADGIWGGTFHSVGNRILRRHAERIGFRSGFSIMDREDQKDLLEAVIGRSGFVDSTRRFPKADVMSDLFSLSLNTGKPISLVVAERYRYFTPIVEDLERLQALYEGRKRETNVMDFDDLLSKTVELMLLHEDIAAIYQEQFRFVLVDEFQDTNRLQSELVDVLARKHGNLMVVGDDAQSIYSWRGADFENILRFPARYPGAKVFRIETNYRSLPAVLDVANAAIAANTRQFRKELQAFRKPGAQQPVVLALETNNHQAAFVAQRALELHEEGIDFSEMAVLYRAHFHSMEIQLEFTRRGIPFEITSGLRFFEQAHIKDVAAYLKFVTNPRDEVSFKRVVRLLPGIGPKVADSLWNQARQALQSDADFAALHAACKAPGKSAKAWTQLIHTFEEMVGRTPSGMIESVLMAAYDDIMQAKFSNYESRRDDLLTLSNYAKQFEDPGEFLSQLALLSGLDNESLGSDEGEKVTLSTVHQAKGLEWKVVFIVWLADGMFPSARSIEDLAGLEEERRLFYVAVTRSKDELYLTYPTIRLNAGYGEAFQRPSRFLSEIPEHLVESWEITAK